MSTEFKWTDNLVAEFIQARLHIVDSASFDLIEQFKESKQRKPLFTSEDGVDIFSDNNVCLLSIDTWNSSWPVKAPSTPFKGDKNQFKYFSTQNAAIEYKLYNQPLLSLNEIEKIGNIDNPDNNIYFQRLVELAKVNLNK